MAHIFGNSFVSKLGFALFSNAKKRQALFSIITECLIIMWLVLMHGNYFVLRDNQTILPFVIAPVLFLTVSSFVRNLREFNPVLPRQLQNLKKRKFAPFLILVFVSGLVGLSGDNSWWGFLMQFSAFFAGAIVGRYSVKSFEPVKFLTFIIFVLTFIILMQPEFFRFGQLGNLTFLHILFILFSGITAISIFAISFVKTKGKFSTSLFKKLKWLSRIIIFMAFILFAFTESVLIFLGLSIALFIYFSVSILHEQENISDNLLKKLWALLLFIFGIITVLPVISICGILYWNSLPKLNVYNKMKFLL